MSNPLLAQGTLPKFSEIKPEHVKPAVEQAIAHCKAVIEEVLANNQEYTWQNLVLPIEAADDALGKMWSPVSHMNSVVNSDELREAYESCLPLLSEYSTFVGQHQPLYQAYKQLADSAHYQTLDKAQQKVIDNALRDFTLSGIALPADKQTRYGEIVARLSELGSKFNNNTLDATQAFTVNITDEAELAGLPQSAKDAAAALAQAKELEGWLFTLDFPSYFPVMTYCDNGELREKMYRAYVTRASDIGPNGGEFDNSEVMAELLVLRHELAQLLDFANYSEKSLATKMADTPEQVIGFLQDLAAKSKPQGEEELAELTAYAEQEFGVSELNAWDLGYYSEKLKQQRYAISDEELRPYFPEQKVVAGLFEVVNRLFGLTIKQRDGVDVWHKDVKFYDVYDENEQLRGSFYLDLYAREKSVAELGWTTALVAVKRRMA